MSCVIRKAVPGDEKAMAALDALCFASPWSEESFHQELYENKLAFYLVIEDETEGIIGYAGLWAVVDEGHITNIAVHPDFRGRGFGTLMLSRMILATQKAGIQRHTLEVRPSNTAALALYEKFGFKEEGRRKGYYEDNGEDALILWRGNV